MTPRDPRPVQMLIDGFGVDDVRVRTRLAWAEIAMCIIESQHFDVLRPQLRLITTRAVQEDRGAA